MADEPSIGQRIRTLRLKRGMTQEALAGLAGFSQSNLSLIETGKSAIEMRSTLVAIARALHVTVGDLTDQPGDPTDPATTAIVSHVPAIRDALIMRELGVRGAPVPEAGTAKLGWLNYDFAYVAPLLADLILNLEGREFVKLANVGAVVLRHVGHGDLGRELARMASTEAQGTEDPAWISLADVIHAMALPPESGMAALSLMRHAGERVEGVSGVDVNARQVLGLTHLVSSLRYATLRRGEDALEHLAEAERLAATLGEPEGLGIGDWCFGPTNVNIWGVAIRGELGDAAGAIRTATATTPEAIALPNRQAPFYADWGSALASQRKDDEAIAMFLRAAAIAPQYARNRRELPDRVRVILRRKSRNAVDGRLRHLATVVGLRDELPA